MKNERLGNERLGLPAEEKEIKIHVNEDVFNDLQERVALQGLARKEYQLVDTYYDDSNFTLTNLNRGLRRRTDATNSDIVEFKSLFYIPELRPQNPWLIEELRIDTTQPSDHGGLIALLQRLNRQAYVDATGINLDQLLESVGLLPRIVVNKKRTEYTDINYTWVFDTVDNLGNFVELESESETNPEDILKSFLSELDYTIVREGYNDMIAKNEPAVVPTHIRQTRFMQNPQWNLLPGENQIIHELLQ